MTDHLPLDPGLVEALTADSDPYLSCDDCFEETDVAVEAVLGTDDGRHERFSEAFRVHLLRCPACHDEARSLAELVAAEFGLTPAEATARLEAELARAA
ncbi:MAG: hypothetical protein JST64_04295 [Actinobacteria bacterium]|nr:hypothetical protein [Actinomycetota bacterium]